MSPGTRTEESTHKEKCKRKSVFSASVFCTKECAETDAEKADFLCISVRASVYRRVRRCKAGKKMTHERSKKGMMGQVVGSLYYLDLTVIPRLKSLRSGDDPVFSFGVLFYALKRNPRRAVQHVDDAAPFKSVFLDQMLHDLIVRMCIDAQVRDLCPAVIDDLGEKSVDCSV